MKRIIPVTILAIFTIAASAQARKEYVFTDQQQFDGSAVKSIKIDMPAGDIKIEKSSGTQIELEFKNIIYAKNKGDAEEMNSRCTNQARIVDDALDISIDMPHNLDRDFFDKLFSGHWDDFNIMLRLGIPDGKSVEINASSADIEASNLKANLDIRSSSSDVEMSDTDGEVICDLSSGDVDMVQHKGNVSISGKSSDVRINGVTGNVDIRTSSGDGKFDEISGNLSITSSSGDYRIFNVGGDLDIRTSSGDVYVDGIKGSVRAETTSGDARLFALSADQGDFEVESVSGDVTMEINPDFAGRLSLRSSSGNIDSRISGKIETQSETKLVASIGAGKGNLKVITTSGDIRVMRY